MCYQMDLSDLVTANQTYHTVIKTSLSHEFIVLIAFHRDTIHFSFLKL